MAATTNVQVIVTAQDQASSVIQSIGNSFRSAASNVSNGANDAAQATNGLSAQMAINAVQAQAVRAGGAIATTAILAMGAAAIAVSAHAVNMASNFQSSMELIRTQAGASQQEVDKMSQAILGLAGDTATAPMQLSEGLYHLESVGLRGSQALDVLKIAAEGAKVGQANLEDTTNALAAAVVSGIKGVKDSAQAMGVLNATVGAGNMRMEDLSASMGTGILATASSFGLSLQDVGAALATMTDNGVPAIDAATRLRMTFSLLGAPTTQAQKALAQVGISSTQLADDMRSKGLIGAIQDLKDHLEASGKTASQQAVVISDAFGGGRSSSAILTMIQQIDRLKTKFADINGATGKFGEEWNATQQTAAIASQRFHAQMEALTVAFGTALLPAVTAVTNFFATSVLPILITVTQWFGKHQVALEIVAGVLGGVFVLALLTATAALWLMVAPAVALVGVWLAFAWPFLLAAAAIGVAVLLIATHLDLIKKVAGEVAKFFENVWTGSIQKLQEFGSWINSTFHGMVSGISNFFTEQWNHIRASVTAFNTWISNAFRSVVSSIHNFFASLWRGVQEVFQSFVRWVVSTFGPSFNVAMNVIKFVLIVINDLFVLAFAGIKHVLTEFGTWLIGVFSPVFTAFYNLIVKILTNEINFWLQVWNTIKSVLLAFGHWLNATFTPIINAALDFIKKILQDLSNFFKTIWDAITDTLTKWWKWLSTEFNTNVNIAFNFIQKILQDLGNFFTKIWDDVTAKLTEFGHWIGSTFTGLIDGAFKWIHTALNNLSEGWSKIWDGMKNFVSKTADDIMGIVKNALNHVIGFFNGLINSANSVGSKLPGYIKIPNLPSFATGGVVPGAIGSPQLIIAHGGETVVPQGISVGAGIGAGSQGITFNVNIGMYAGTEVERRNIAKRLYQSLVQLANSQHKSVAEYMGG